MGPEIVQGHDTLYCGSERGGNFRIARIGDVTNAFYFKIMDLGVKSIAQLTCGPGKINHDSVGVFDIYFHAVRPEPVLDRLAILRCQTESLSKLLGG